LGKLISNIQNYPLSAGAVAYSNKILLEDNFAIKQNELKDDFKNLFELSKNIFFYNDLGTNSNTWNDLLKKDIVFQLSRFLTISTTELNRFFTELPQTNGFNSDAEITQAEYETLCYQRLQIIQYLFWFYKTIGESITDNNQQQILSVLKSASVLKLFVQYQALQAECLITAPILVQDINKIPVAPFNDTTFPTIDDSLTNSLISYYNPTNITGGSVLTIYADAFDKIKAANEYLYSIFKSLLQTQQTFNQWANNKLAELTNSTNTHQPHIALLIAFCKLKMLYDARYNQLIHSNTNFVFSDILQLKKQAVIADTAYVNIELAKNINQYFLAKNSLFKAGKNSANKPVYYHSTKDMILNSAKISYLKSSVRINKQNQLFTVSGTDDAANAEWQVNDAWLAFNDLSESYTGIAIESKLLASIQKKGTEIDFEFTFDSNVPSQDSLADKFLITLLLNNGTEETLKVVSATTSNSILKISTKVENDLKQNLKDGINARLKLVSPSKNEQDNGNVILYKFLLSEPIGKIKVALNQQTFVPSNVQTAAGTFDGSTSFTAFGAQSLAGSSFRIANSFIKYASTIDIKINWADTLKDAVTVLINNQQQTFTKDTETTTINDFANNNASNISIKLKNDLTYLLQSTKRGARVSTIESSLPRVLLVKSIELTANLEELVYEKENQRPVIFIEDFYNRQFLIKSLRVPFTSKTRQKQALYNRHLQYRIRYSIPHYNNLTAHLYPLGERSVNKSSGLTFLPDYSLLGFSNYQADLYIGLINIIPGQSISLLFELAEETAEQTELEAKISWHFISNDEIEKIDGSKIIDTTSNFLQSGIVQLTLPETATNQNSIVYGANTYWLVARCDKNYEVVANVRSIKTNGVEVLRVLDVDNQEAKKSVAANTIENLFPKTANVKSVTQNTPSQNGRELETDQHYFWRSSQRLRHKSRAINQWDFEQMVLEKFSNIYKVKCLNHAYYDNATSTIVAKPAHTLISLIPHYIINTASVNFQPAISMSKLLAVEAYLQTKTSAFQELQIFNSHWDEILIEIQVVLNRDVLDLLFYRELLNTDIKKFLSPWAFDAGQAPTLSQKIYTSTLVDYIDELPYVHHITLLKIFKNSIELFDEITSTTEIHFLTSAIEHTVTVFEYAN
jgi:hypothetical protein